MSGSMLHHNITEAQETLENLRGLEASIEAAAQLVQDALLGGRKLLACGNGGSAADAAHFTTEFVCRFSRDRRPYPAICLSTHGGDLTAIGNDYDFRDVFARQVQAFGQPNDVLWALSSSGNSENVSRALRAAKGLDVRTVALLGGEGTRCRDIADIDLIIPSTVGARVQEAQKLVIHTICELVELSLLSAACSTRA